MFLSSNISLTFISPSSSVFISSPINFTIWFRKKNCVKKYGCELIRSLLRPQSLVKEVIKKEYFGFYLLLFIWFHSGTTSDRPQAFLISSRVVQLYFMIHEHFHRESCIQFMTLHSKQSLFYLVHQSHYITVVNLSKEDFLYLVIASSSWINFTCDFLKKRGLFASFSKEINHLR